MAETALLLAHRRLATPFAKTAHGLIRGPSRFPLAGVVDPDHAGRDAGELLDGRSRGLRVFASLTAALETLPEAPTVCVVGIATPGGRLPPDLRGDLLLAARAGMTLVNGLHHLLADDPEIARASAEAGGRIVDLRRPRPVAELRFWSGEVLRLETPRIAVLGTDCAVGKRTTATLLRAALAERGLRAEIVYTGQTGWLQGFRHGFILDATPNDFVSGELERAVVECAREAAPDVVLIEGQASLRNPSGPCGSELIVSAGAAGVVLQHAPARRCFVDLEEIDCEIPPLAEEIELVRLLGAEVWAVTLNPEGLDAEAADDARRRLAAELGLPVALPLTGGLQEVAEAIGAHIAGGNHR